MHVADASLLTKFGFSSVTDDDKSEETGCAEEMTE